MGGHIHEHQIGGDAIPIGEMRKVQGKYFQLRLGVVGSPALAASVDRPYLEDVDRAIDESGNRMGGAGGTDGNPGITPVDPVLVIRDRRPRPLPSGSWAPPPPFFDQSLGVSPFSARTCT